MSRYSIPTGGGPFQRTAKGTCDKAPPANVQEFLETTSAQFSQTPDFAGTAFLAAISGLIGRSIRLKMRQGDEWYEVANSWAILVGRPSTKKSPILRRILGLFEELEAKAAEEFKKLKKAYKEKKREAAKNDEEFDEPEPKRRRYTTDDVTMPKLRELMAANPNGIILRNDELKGQLERLEKTGSEGDRSFMMNCWSGLEVYSEDRMCRDSHINIPLSLTWIGCIPPSPLQRYLREAMGRGSGADGFMQRFQLVCFPDVQKEFALPTHTLLVETIDSVKELISEVDSGVRESQRTLSFCIEEAQKHFDEWLVKHENRARSGQHPIYWESHLGKQATALAVLTIVLHRLDECAQGHQTDIVNLHTLEQALRLLQYYEAHARRCYDSVAGATVDDAKAVISLLRERRLPHRFKAQDIYGQGLGGLEDSRRVRAALELLEDKDWLVVEKVGSTGRKHEYWILNPRAFEN
jgi:putative DNA primase/helicase